MIILYRFLLYIAPPLEHKEVVVTYYVLLPHKVIKQSLFCTFHGSQDLLILLPQA